MTELEIKIDNYIKEKFAIAYIISTQAPIFLIGGAIRSIMYDEEPRDLDFVVHGNKYINEINKVLNKYNITPGFNKFGGYKFNYNGISIDLWTTDDIYSSIQYNVDGLLFNLANKKLISLTFEDFEENGLMLINNNLKNGVGDRYEKLKRFEKKFFNE